MIRQDLPPNLRVISTLDSDDERFNITDRRAVRALAAAEERHFWHLSRNKLISENLTRLGLKPPARILELGCGGGCVSAHLSREGYKVTGVDGHLSLLLEASVRAPAARFVVCDLATRTSGIDEDSFDAVGLFDVIEHLDDPGNALRLALSLVKPGGFVVGTVPALMRLWSRVDVQAGHRLRYEKASLAALLDSLRDARTVEIAQFNRQLVPIMMVQRRLVAKQDVAGTAEANFRLPPTPVNQAFLMLAYFERLLAPVLNRTGIRGASLWFALQPLLSPTTSRGARPVS